MVVMFCDRLRTDVRDFINLELQDSYQNWEKESLLLERARIMEGLKSVCGEKVSRYALDGKMMDKSYLFLTHILLSELHKTQNEYRR